MCLIFWPYSVFAGGRGESEGVCMEQRQGPVGVACVKYLLSLCVQG